MIVTISGMQDVLKKLRKLESTLQNKIIIEAVTTASEPVFARMKTHAPKKTGRLVGNLGIRIYRKRKALKVSIGVKSKKTAYIGPVEMGHFTRKSKYRANYRRKIPATKFMRNAFINERDRISRRVGELLKRKIDWAL